MYLSMIIKNSETQWIMVLILLFKCTSQINCNDLFVNELTNFSPCTLFNDSLTCDAHKMDTVYQNKSIQFLRSTRQNITKIAILNFKISELQANVVNSFSTDLLWLKILSKTPINVINPLAFFGCGSMIFLEINGASSADSTYIDLGNVLSPLVSLEELRLINLKIQNLTENYFIHLTSLKSFTIESAFLKSISSDTFRNNKKLTFLSFSAMIESSDVIETLETWPLSSKLPLKTLYIEKCNLKKFPKLNINLVQNLSQLSLAKNPIEQIDINDTVTLIQLEVLSLVATKIKWDTVPGLRLLTNLKDLKITDVHTLTDLPAEIEAMTLLESIYLDLSKFDRISTALPASIKKISASNLEKPIEITSNFLSKSNQLNILYMMALPMDNIQFLLDNVKVINNSLNVLSLDETSLIKNRLMEFLGSLRNLEVLHLNKANIDFIPDNVLINLKGLKKLMLSGNQLRYEAINTNGFQTILTHLTDLDLSKNQLTYLPPCLFYSFSNFNGLNILENHLICDCHLLWLYDTIKRQKINNKRLNFTCGSGSNDGKTFNQLSEIDLKNCSSKFTDNCNPLKSAHYPIPFYVKYNVENSILSISNIKGDYLRFLYDYFTFDIKQFNASFHTDFDKYDITRTSVEVSITPQLQDVQVCLILNRNKVDYKYSYNCQIVSLLQKVLESRLTVLTGSIVGAVLLVVIIIVVVVCYCKKKEKKKKNIYFEASSTEYSEPDDTYKTPDQYTEISNNECSLDQGDPYDNPYKELTEIYPSQTPLNTIHVSLSLPSKSMDNIRNSNKIQLNPQKPRFRKLAHISKLIAKARSSSNINERRSLPIIDDSITMQDLVNRSSATLPRQYVDRELPQTPATNVQQSNTVDFVPPKPRLSNYNIQNLLNNTDENLRKFSKFVSTSSLNSEKFTERSRSINDDFEACKVVNNGNGKLRDGRSVNL